jgi:hypothetical protein
MSQIQGASHHVLGDMSQGPDAASRKAGVCASMPVCINSNDFSMEDCSRALAELLRHNVSTNREVGGHPDIRAAIEFNSGALRGWQ